MFSQAYQLHSTVTAVQRVCIGSPSMYPARGPHWPMLACEALLAWLFMMEGSALDRNEMNIHTAPLAALAQFLQLVDNVLAQFVGVHRDECCTAAWTTRTCRAAPRRSAAGTMLAMGTRGRRWTPARWESGAYTLTGPCSGATGIATRWTHYITSMEPPSAGCQVLARCSLSPTPCADSLGALTCHMSGCMLIQSHLDDDHWIQGRATPQPCVSSRNWRHVAPIDGGTDAIKMSIDCKGHQVICFGRLP
jgi:hypothetical protein